MALKILFIMDPREKILPEMDTSLKMIEEFQRQGHSVFYLNIRAHSKITPLELLVEKLLPISSHPKELLPTETTLSQSAETFDLIFHRLDPPVDSVYQNYCQAFQSLKKPLQINNPWEISHTFEHTLPMEFAEHAIPTSICRNFNDFTTFIRSAPGESVAKPINECSGIGIEFFSPQTPQEKLKQYWEKFSPDVILQPYREAIISRGDLRVLVFNEIILGAVLRKAAPGSRLSNIHQGGSAHPFQVTPAQLKATQEVCQKLKSRGLYFIGLDFIGEELSEINITSPTTLTYINDFYNIKAEETIVRESLTLWEQRKK